MAAAIATVNVDCPRCADPTTLNVEATPLPPKPGAKTAKLDLKVVDLADRFAEHYQAAGHTTCP